MVVVVGAAVVVVVLVVLVVVLGAFGAFGAFVVVVVVVVVSTLKKDFSIPFKIIVPNIFNAIITPLHLFLQSKCLPIYLQSTLNCQM